MTETFYAFVPHAEIPEWEAKGWRVCAQLGYYHGQFSVLMERGYA